MFIMNIIDTYSSILSCYDSSGFSFKRWKTYIDSALPGLYALLTDDAKSMLNTGGVTEEDYLSVLNNVVQNRELLDSAHKSFLHVTDGLETAIYQRFGKTLDVTVHCISVCATAQAGSPNIVGKPQYCSASKKL